MRLRFPSRTIAPQAARCVRSRKARADETVEARIEMLLTKPNVQDRQADTQFDEDRRPARIASGVAYADEVPATDVRVLGEFMPARRRRGDQARHCAAGLEDHAFVLTISGSVD
jgi:hypothetical protein